MKNITMNSSNTGLVAKFRDYLDLYDSSSEAMRVNSVPRLNEITKEAYNYHNLITGTVLKADPSTLCIYF